MPAPGRGVHFADPHAAEDRAARERAERSLETARETILHLQTRIGHDELALREALGQVEARDETIAQLREQVKEQHAQLGAARSAAERSEHLRQEAEAAADEQAEQHRDVIAALKAELSALKHERSAMTSQPVATFAHPAAGAKPARPTRAAKTTAIVEEDEAEPVQWWLTSESKAKPAGRRSKG